MPSYYVASTPTSRHRSHSHSGHSRPGYAVSQPVAYSTSHHGHGSSGQYLYPGTPAYSSYNTDGLRRYNSVSGGGGYYPSTPSYNHRSTHSMPGQGSTYYVAPSPSHHGHKRHRRSHSTSSHRHRHGSTSYSDGSRHHRYNQYPSSSHRYRSDLTLADRIRNFFGFGHGSRSRYTDARTGAEVDRWGRPVVRY